MSYQGYTPVMVRYLETVSHNRRSTGSSEPVTILEIGVDKGQTSLILMSSLVAKGIPFIWTGVDIRKDDILVEQINLMEGVDHMIFKGQVKSESYAEYCITNSLDHLKKDKNIYDLVLIDGDHNYDTVSQELSHLDTITHDLSLVICDDYAGIHAGKDAFYSDNELHRDLAHVSSNLSKDVNKGGVTAAIDEFIMHHDDWYGMHMLETYEPCFLYKRLGFDISLKPNVVFPERRDFVIMHSENYTCSFYPAAPHPVSKHMHKEKARD